jgi:hypothetical protein
VIPGRYVVPIAGGGTWNVTGCCSISVMEDRSPNLVAVTLRDQEGHANRPSPAKNLRYDVGGRSPAGAWFFIRAAARGELLCRPISTKSETTSSQTYLKFQDWPI